MPSGLKAPGDILRNQDHWSFKMSLTHTDPGSVQWEVGLQRLLNLKSNPLWFRGTEAAQGYLGTRYHDVFTP